MSPHEFKTHQLLFDKLSHGSFERDASTNLTHWNPLTKEAQNVYRNMNRSRLQECLRNKRIYLTGTSYQRTVFWSLLQWITAKQDLDLEYLMISSAEKMVRAFSYGKECTRHDPKHVHPMPWLTTPNKTACIVITDDACNKPGPAGINIKKCGLPMHAEWRSKDRFNITLHYQFKTYISAPGVDQHIFKTLKASHYDAVLLSSGEWGTYNDDLNAFDAKDLFEAFLKELDQAYKGVVVFNYDADYSPKTAKLGHALEGTLHIMLIVCLLLSCKRIPLCLILLCTLL